MFLFVGERPSETAKQKGWTWRDGRLAAKQLFDALSAIGLDPLRQRFDNIFVPDADVVCPRAARRVRSASKRGVAVVAMGRKVEAELTALGVHFRSIPHPAARGAIRKKERYAAAVLASLSGGEA